MNMIGFDGAMVVQLNGGQKISTFLVEFNYFIVIFVVVNL